MSNFKIIKMQTVQIKKPSTYLLKKLIAVNLLLLLFQFVNAACPLHNPNFTTSVNGNTVTLTLSGEGYNSYTCGFGDATYGTQLTHSYTTTGVKTICVRFQYVDSNNTANHCDTTICKTIGLTSMTPFRCPIQSPEFSAAVNGNTVTLTKTGSGYSSYSWTYGDGGSGTSNTHTYTSSGAKTICLIVQYVDSTNTSHHCDTAVCQTITIAPATFGCPIQSPGFSASVNGNTVTLSKTGGGYNIYSWTYGDGGSGTSNTHTYTSSGVKTICLIVQYVDSNNTSHHCDTAICKQITIASAFTCPIEHPGFTTSVNGNTVTLTSTTSGYTSFIWYYGDNTTGTSSTHTYTSSGVKTICLALHYVDSSNTSHHCDTTICKEITIAAAFTCPIQSPGFSALVNGNTVTLTKIGGGYNFYTWTYGDGTSGTTNSHTYTSSGVKTICLKLQYVDTTNTSHHCDTTICQVITIASSAFVCPIEHPGFSASVNGNVVTLTKTGSGYNSYTWTYGDGGSGTASTHTYTTSGVKTICLRLQYVDTTNTSHHCDTTICQAITISTTPFVCPIQSPNFTAGVNGNTVTVALAGSGYNSYLIGWGDVTYGTELSHSYTSTGVKTICIKFQYFDSTNTARHCDTTICKTVGITSTNPFRCPIQSPNFSAVVVGNTVTLTKTGGGYNYYSWSYGDGTNGTSNTHTYTSSGVKQICLHAQYVDTLNTSHHCDTTICQLITVFSTTPFVCPIEHAGFSASVNGNVVTLTKTGSGYNSWLWTYGDGTSGTSATHTYTSSGAKTICLKFQYVDSTNTSHHCDTTICQTITIAPTTTFVCPIHSPNFTTSINGNTVTLVLAGSDYNSYIIGWGDVTYGTELSHHYTSTGVKTICVRFQYLDSTNTTRHCDTTICKTVGITSTNPFVCPIEHPGFSAVVNGNTVTLTKTGSGYNYYLWNYGDGVSGTGNTYTYTSSGVKTICIKFQYVDTTNTSHHCDTTICQTITIGTPTFVCPIERPGFIVNVSGNTVILTKTGSGYNSYIWGYGDVTYGTDSVHTYTATGIKTICLRLQYVDSTNTSRHCDTTICRTVNIESFCDSGSCVLPGDADHDLTVNNFDIFPIGMSYNRQGLTRPNATTQYVLQPAPDWTSDNYFGFNDKFVDCNGDGRINNNDASVILQNYVVKPFNHYNHRIANTDSLPPVFLAFDSIPIFQIGANCNTTEIVSDINIGSATQNANNVYGIGFSVDYPESFISDSCFKIQIDLDANSWFATNEPVLYLYKNIPEYHRVDIGIVRTSGTSRSGNGKIGKIKFVVEDGIFVHRGTSSNKQYTFDISGVAAIDNNGLRIGMTGQSTTANFVVAGIQSKQIEGLRLYPNPVTDRIYITAGEMIESITVYDIAGQVIRQEAVNGFEKVMDVNDLGEGMYMFEIHSENAVSIMKIIKSR
ncbi:MAG: hypothetical protein JWN78_1285 [Bacteroidota bacterium]|nr:hypothetical protein [Bacteroidota bacterium]